MTFVYWVHDDNCSCPDFHGYVGISEDPQKRLYGSRAARTVPANSELMILFEGTREQCLKVERKYRPKKRIGWNTARGGAASEPKIHGRAVIKGIFRVGYWKETKAAKLTHQIFICFLKTDRPLIARLRKQIEEARL